MDLILQKLKLIHIKDLNIHDPGFLEIAFLTTMAIRVVEFSSGGYKIKNIFAYESTYPKEIFEYWELDSRGSLSSLQKTELIIWFFM